LPSTLPPCRTPPHLPRRQCARRRHPRPAGPRRAARTVVAMPYSCLITGATGFVGGHLAEACAARGLAARALARPGSDTALLQQHGVAVVPGDLGDAAAVRAALEGVEVVFHCAAKVGDWGPVEGYRAVNVEGLRGLLEACRGRPLRRFVHFSTLGVYAA